MKTLPKLLYVEADEEITDLVDRLRDLSVEDEVTFVVPDRARSLQSAMSFRLLKRYADSYGKRVNVISSDPRLQAMSEETGFTAYPSLAAYDQTAAIDNSDFGSAPNVPAFTPTPPTEPIRAPQFEPNSRTPQAEPISRAPQAPPMYAPRSAPPASPVPPPSPVPLAPASPWAQQVPATQPPPTSPWDERVQATQPPPTSPWARQVPATQPPPPPPPAAQRLYGASPFSPSVPARPADVMSAPPKKPTPPAPAFVREPPPLRSYRPYVIGAGILAVAALLAGILYLPSATATLTVQGTPIKADITLNGAPGVAAGATDQFPTQAIHGDESQTLPGTATGQKQVAAVAATGSVTFRTGCSSCTDSVRKGQIVETNNNIQYATQQRADNVTANHDVTVPITAVAAGAAGNVPALAVQNIISYDGSDTLLSVDNGQATTGGADARTATVIQQSDIDNVTTGYLKDATTRVTDTINGKAGGLKLITVGNGISSKVTTDHKVGDEVNSFSITVKVTGDAVAFDDKAPVALLLGDLQHKIPQGTQLAGTPTESYDTTGATADGHITVNGHVSGFYTPIFLVSKIRSYLKGMSPTNARAFLQSLPNVLDARVVQSPFGLPWLPLFSSRITVNIQDQEVSGTASP